MAEICCQGTGPRNVILTEAIASGGRVSRVSFADIATRLQQAEAARTKPHGAEQAAGRHKRGGD
jgi:hypothetical protein